MIAADRNLAGRVWAGALLLDADRPGWRERIEPEALDIAWPKRCVLGQEFGHFGDGKVTLGLSTEDTIGLGFYAPYDDDYFPTCLKLTGLWRALLAPDRGEG